MVSHYAASLTFDDALRMYKVVNTGAQLLCPRNRIDANETSCRSPQDQRKNNRRDDYD
jgi:hypothetical protein